MFVSKDPIDNNPTLACIITWHRIGDKPFQCWPHSPTHICGTCGRRVKSSQEVSHTQTAISQSGCNVRGHCSPKFFCLFCLMFNCIQIALLLGHIYVKLQSTVFHIKEIIEEYLRLHWRGYGRDNLFIYLKWISFCGKNISFVHILFLCYWN